MYPLKRAIDDASEIVRELSVAGDPDAFAVSTKTFASDIHVIGFEAGLISPFLASGLESHRLTAILMETRQVSAALATGTVKSDQGGAWGIVRTRHRLKAHQAGPSVRDEARVFQIT